MHRELIRIGMVIAAVFGLAPAAWAGMMFSLNTDTISIAGNTVLSDRATYEATVTFTSISNSENRGFIFNDWEGGLEDEQFDVLNGNLSAYAYPLDSGPMSGSALSTGVQYDLAYVYDGSQERLYIDGSLVASRASTGTISTGGITIAAVGAIYRDGFINYSFLGTLQSLRISNTSRYSGSSYTPTYGDFSNDTSTILLYDFDSAPVNGTITDLSNTGHTGTLGVGFTGATSPTFVAAPADVPEPAGLAAMGVAAAMCLIRRRGPWRNDWESSRRRVYTDHAWIARSIQGHAQIDLIVSASRVSQARSVSRNRSS
jgi:hypothetical protein